MEGPKKDVHKLLILMAKNFEIKNTFSSLI